MTIFEVNAAPVAAHMPTDAVVEVLRRTGRQCARRGHDLAVIEPVLRDSERNAALSAVIASSSCWPLFGVIPNGGGKRGT